MITQEQKCSQQYLPKGHRSQHWGNAWRVLVLCEWDGICSSRVSCLIISSGKMPQHIIVPSTYIVQKPAVITATFWQKPSQSADKSTPLKTQGFHCFPWDLMLNHVQFLKDIILTKASNDGKKHHPAPAMAPCQTSGTRCLQRPGISKQKSHLRGGLIMNMIINEHAPQNQWNDQNLLFSHPAKPLSC